MKEEKKETVEYPTHKIVFEVFVKADNMDEALTKARNDVGKFRCHHLDIEVL